MGQIVRRKKKGRPSKADLARRSGESPAAAEAERRRSLRRRNVKYNIDYDDYLDEEDEDDEEDERTREKKKLKLVMKLDQGRSGDETAPNRTRAELRGSHAPGYVSASEDDDSERKSLKKRRISGVGSDNDNGQDDDEEEEENGEGEDNQYEEDDDDHGRIEVKGKKVDSKKLHTVPGTPADVPSGIPLPDKKTLELILDKLQKKDTYGVYAEPVDPEELPDYHDVIEHPMDFATVRKKLANASYSTLEQFESDLFLICSNAMQYNSPETIYHKQARSIQELARKKFEKLRINFEHSEREMKSEQKARSSSLVKKQPKKPVCRTMQEPVGSDFSSGATLATMGDIQPGSYVIQGGGCEKPGNNDGLVEGNASLTDANLEKTEDLLSGKSLPSKLGRKAFVLDENRRATYNISNQPVVRSESILTTFEGETKQLVAVGLHAEYSYARSLAQFAATLGPVAWKVASQRIVQALPASCKFGHGWVGEYEPLPTPVLMVNNCMQKESCLIEKWQSTEKLRKDHHNSKTPVPAKEHPVNGPTSDGRKSSIGSASGHSSEGKPSLFGPSSSKPNSPVNVLYQQHNFQPKNFTKPESKVSKQVELNSFPSANQNNASLVAKFSSNAATAAPNSREMVHRNMNILQSVPFRQPDTNGVVSAEFPNGKMNTSLNRRVTTPSSDSVANQMGRAATYFPNEQEQGLTDPVQLMRILAEKGLKQQNSSVDSPPVAPSVPSGSREDSSNAAAAAARAWMSVGAGAGGCKRGTDSSSSPKNQISADSLYNPSREFYQHISRVKGEFSPGGMPFQTPKNSFPLQAFAAQPIHVGNEAQLQTRPIVFPQFAATDLSRFQMQSPWRGLSPHNQPRQKQDMLPPDLNIGFQSPGSPVRQSSGVLVDSQQPDLALQL
ncbi:Bromodomain containing protein [Quillaja saponaria]|uniref:Bromodomain containing protein n=1 Tax=Quillaja saponaria TaxID=32244 RepID=A0AAD7LMB0_QUISA|nr:Bromodomain containing protein [Quillaja saponaria]